MKKAIYTGVLLFICGIILSGCSDTPNDITMSVNQGQCLTGGTDGASPYNPATAPYCMSVTLQNNNSGSNANNVQVTSAGLTLGYSALTATGLQNFSNTICDLNASAGVCPSGTTQIGNITIFDPNNCATQQGSQVSTLMANGGSCTFFLQIAAESFAIGSYPITITYNYTNSNQNYSIATTLYQNVNLYSGGENGLYLLNSSQLQLAESAANTSVVAHDNYGNLYFNNGRLIYSYNGLSFTQVGDELPGSITSLTADNNGNLIAAVAANGLYYNNLSAASNWQILTDTQSLLGSTDNIFGIAYTNTQAANILYVIESSSAYSCLESIANSSVTLACSIINQAPDQGPLIYFPNSLAAFAGNLYAGTTGEIQGYNESGWVVYNSFTSVLPTNDYASTIVASGSGIIFGVDSQSVYTESSVFSCNLLPESSCIVQLSSSGNYITGNIHAVTVDGAGYIYGVGANINSADFSGFTNTIGFFESGASIATALWQPITNGVGAGFNSPVAVSSLVK
jgi:hypothetical protein